MSIIPMEAEILGERLGRDPKEMESLLREVLTEVSRRRWVAMSADEKQRLHEELERARSVDEEPFPADVAATIPLSMLPFFVRRVRDDLAVARGVWFEAYEGYQELLKKLTLRYYEQEGMQITVADRKAHVDPRVREASAHSLRQKKRLEALERAESNLLHELEVRLVLIRSGVVNDPEAVPMRLRTTRIGAG